MTSLATPRAIFWRACGCAGQGLVQRQGGSRNGLGSRFRGHELAGDATRAKHNYAVRVFHHFGKIGADHHHRRAIVGQAAHDAMNLRFRSDVDAACWFIENQDSGRVSSQRAKTTFC